MELTFERYGSKLRVVASTDGLSLVTSNNRETRAIVLGRRYPKSMLVALEGAVSTDGSNGFWLKMSEGILYKGRTTAEIEPDESLGKFIRLDLSHQWSDRAEADFTFSITLRMEEIGYIIRFIDDFMTC